MTHRVMPLVCLVLGLILGTPVPGYSQSHRQPSLPSPDLLLQELVEPLLARARDPRWHCSADGKACACLTFISPDHELTVGQWEAVGDLSLELDQVVLRLAATGATYRFETMAIETARGELSFTEMSFWDGRDSSPVLRAGQGRLGPGDSGPGPMTLKALRWEQPSMELISASLSHACPAEHLWPLDDVRGNTVVTSAKSARFDGKRWQLSGLRAVDGRVPLGDARVTPNQGVSGVFPSTFRYVAPFFETEAGYYVAPLSAAIVANAAPGHWYGAGALLVSEPPDGEFLGLAGQARWGHDRGELDYHVVGDAFWGNRLTHLSMSLEESGDPMFWRAEQLGRGAFFRTWRRSGAGISLSGEGHTLDARLIHGVVSAGEGAGEHHDYMVGSLSYGSRTPLGAAGELVMGLGHRVSDAGANLTHESSMRLGWGRVFGQARGGLLQPRILSSLGFARLPAEVGTEVASSGAVVGRLDGSVAFDGRFKAGTHGVRPGFSVAREVVGFDRNLEALPFNGAASWVERLEGWTLFSAQLEQRWQSREPWSIDLPVGIVWSGDEFEQAATGTPDLFAKIRFNAVQERPWSLDLAILCRQLCDDIDFLAGAQMQWSPLLSTRHSLSRITPMASTWWAHQDRPGWDLSPWAIRAHGGDFVVDDEAEILHVSTVHARWTRFSLAVSLPGALNRLDGHGVDVLARLSLWELGWHIFSRGAAMPQDSDWAVMVGLGL